MKRQSSADLKPRSRPHHPPSPLLGRWQLRERDWTSNVDDWPLEELPARAGPSAPFLWLTETRGARRWDNPRAYSAPRLYISPNGARFRRVLACKTLASSLGEIELVNNG